MSASLEEALRPLVHAATEMRPQVSQEAVRGLLPPFIESGHAENRRVSAPPPEVVPDYRQIARHVAARLDDDQRFKDAVEACAQAAGDRSSDPRALVEAFLSLYFVRAEGEVDEAALTALWATSTGCSPPPATRPSSAAS